MPRPFSSCPRNSLSVPRSQTAPRNAKIVLGNILALGNAGTIPGNVENQNEQVSFSYASRLLFGKAQSL